MLQSWLLLRVVMGAVLWVAVAFTVDEVAAPSRAAVVFAALVLMPVVVVRLVAVRPARLTRSFPRAFVFVEGPAALFLAWSNVIAPGPNATLLAAPYVCLGGTAILWSAAQLVLRRVRTAEAWAAVAASVGLMAGVTFIFLERSAGPAQRLASAELASRLVTASAHSHYGSLIVPLIAGWLCGWTKAAAPRIGLAVTLAAGAMLATVPTVLRPMPLRELGLVASMMWVAGLTPIVVTMLRLASALRQGPAAWGIALGGITWAAVAVVMVAESVGRMAGLSSGDRAVLATLHGALAAYAAAPAALFGLALSGGTRRRLGRRRWTRRLDDSDQIGPV